jgi:hypothetical protein
MKHPRGDRFGGVVFDIQQLRKGAPIMEGGDIRESLILITSELILLIEDMDEKQLNPIHGLVILDECICRENDGRNAAPVCPVHDS